MSDPQIDAAVASFRAFNRVHTRFADVLKPRYMGTDLSLIEARLLYEIATREPVLAAELQQVLDLDAGYASRLLRRFEERGLIRRGRGGDDARQRPIELTPAGRDDFEALDARTHDQAARRLAPLSAAGRATLAHALDSARAVMAGGELPWTIRTFRPGDMGMIAARQSILYADYGWGRPMEVLLGDVTTAFLRGFKPGREQCWVAERGGRMVGSIFLVDSAEGAQLRLLFVEPEARGLGVGEALARTCIEFAREAGYSRLWLWTHTILASARRIYAGVGLQIVSTEMHDEFGKPEQGEIWDIAL